MAIEDRVAVLSFAFVTSCALALGAVSGCKRSAGGSGDRGVPSDGGGWDASEGAAASGAKSEQPGGDGASSTAKRLQGTSAAPEHSFLQRDECKPSGHGKDYLVGPGPKALASLDDVPWESLGPGDTVRIQWRPEPYRSRFQISGKGSAQSPIRVCGIKGENGQRPVIDGKGATARRQIAYSSNEAEMGPLAIVLIDRDWGEAPTYVVIDGLEIRGALEDHSLKLTNGKEAKYARGAACIRVQRGQHIILRENVVHECGNGIFSMSKDESKEAETTSDLLIEGNHIYDCGNPGSDREHSSYVQTQGVVYQFNHYGPLRSRDGKVAGGSSLKDRSSGTVVRYNYIEEGARSLDLVDPQDWPDRALKSPSFGATYVYGNIFKKSGLSGKAIHYGGDTYETKIYRKGTLYFYNNTFVLTGEGHIFQLSTQEEHAKVFNNVFYAEPGVPLYLRDDQGGNGGDVSGGTIILGVNWFSNGWKLQGEYDETQDHVTGEEKALSGPSAPIDLSTFVPRSGAAIVDKGEAVPSEHPVRFEYTPDLLGRPRSQRGAALDLGALELR